MTRDEAIEKLRASHPRIDTAWNCGLWVDSFVALGMLKLDEPKSAREKFEEKAVAMYGWLPASDSGSLLSEIREILDLTGLKIVEK